MNCHGSDIDYSGLTVILIKNDLACDHFVILNVFIRYKILIHE